MAQRISSYEFITGILLFEKDGAELKGIHAFKRGMYWVLCTRSKKGFTEIAFSAIRTDMSRILEKILLGTDFMAETAPISGAYSTEEQEYFEALSQKAVPLSEPMLMI